MPPLPLSPFSHSPTHPPETTTAGPRRHPIPSHPNPSQPHLHPSSKVTSKASKWFVRSLARGGSAAWVGRGRADGRTQWRKRKKMWEKRESCSCTSSSLEDGAPWRRKLPLHTCSSFFSLSGLHSPRRGNGRRAVAWLVIKPNALLLTSSSGLTIRTRSSPAEYQEDTRLLSDCLHLSRHSSVHLYILRGVASTPLLLASRLTRDSTVPPPLPFLGCLSRIVDNPESLS